MAHKSTLMHEPNVTLASQWTDLVFHVLAHVAATAHRPSSIFDPHYIDFCKIQLGSPTERALAQDIAVLAQVLDTHERLAKAQVLAWLFLDLDQSARVASSEIHELDPGQVASPAALRAICNLGFRVECLRAAAELEAEHYRKLPMPHVPSPRLEKGFSQLAVVAPRLGDTQVSVSRALCRRGRIFEGTIVVGCPDEQLGVSEHHVIWQAAHEATVLEVEQPAVEAGLDERAIEAAALVLMTERATRANLAEEHGLWLAHFGPHYPRPKRKRLSDLARAVIDTCERATQD